MFVLTNSLTAQNKYFIYFKDKGIPKDQTLLKSSQQFIQAEKLLSERSIERRKKSMGEDNYITYEDIPLYQNYVNDVENLGIKIIRKLKWFNAVTANLSDEQLRQIKNLDFVVNVERVKILKYKYLDEEAPSLPNYQESNKTGSNTYSYGPSLAQSEFSNVTDVHNLGITGANVRIGIMDSGFEWQNNPALAGTNVIAEYDFVNDDNITSNQAGDISTQHNHGTNVMSVITGFSPDTLIGVAFDSEFVLAKTEDIPSETHVEEDNYAAALEWFDQLGVDVTNSSLGYNEFDPGEFSYEYSDMNGTTAIVTMAANLAFTRGIVCVTSAGNEGNGAWYYITAPADAFNIISVGAATATRNLASYSSRGPTFDGRIKPEIVNQGSTVWVANPFGSYKYSNGTSFSSPLTAGIVSLLLSAHPHLKNTQVRKIILESGDQSENPDNDFGWGLISATKAIGFPNVASVNNQFEIHKIIFSSNGISEGTVYINYRINNGELQSNNLSTDGNQKFKFALNGFTNGDSIHFYFTYDDLDGITTRVPEVNNYQLIFGNLDILLSIDDINYIPENYVLEQNYPNPFNLSTTIEFFPVRNEFAELIVHDILGRKVKTLFKGMANVGEEPVLWDGTNNHGLGVPSGVYYYILNIGGSRLTKKMVLLK
jgi:hypothetical protein